MTGLAESKVDQVKVQLESIKKEIEAIKADMINVGHRLNDAIGLYYELTLCADQLAKDLKNARDAVQEKSHYVIDIRRRLCKVHAELEAARREEAMRKLNSNNKIQAICGDCTTCTPSVNHGV